MYSIVFLPAAEKFYKELYYSDRSHFDRVTQAVRSIAVNPRQGKPLRHKLKGKYSLRVGIYRIIYTIAHKKITVYIMDIGHRHTVYQ